MTYQTDEENAGRTVPPERGRLFSEYVLTILRSFEQATTSDNVVSAFQQVGIHWKLLDQANTDSRVTYVDPATARVVVDEFGVIPLPDEFRVQPSPTWQLKIADLNSAHQSEMALQLTRELEAIRAELPPRTERRFVHSRPTHQRGSSKSSPGPSRRPSGCPSRPRPAFRRARRFPTHTHTQMAGMKSYWGAATPRRPKARGLFKPLVYF